MDPSQMPAQPVDGGMLNPMASDGMEVQGDNPGMTDDVSLDGQAFVDDGEMLWDTQDSLKVFSDTLKPPGSKKTFAELAKSLFKQKKEDDPRFQQATERINQKLEELFGIQQILNGDSQGEPADVPPIPGEQPGIGYDPQANPGEAMFMNGGMVYADQYAPGPLSLNYGKFKMQKGGKLQVQDSSLYNYKAAKAAGLQPDSTGHWPSRVPSSGLLLKSVKHPTFNKTIEGEKAAGYSIYSKGDSLFSFPKDSTVSKEYKPFKMQNGGEYYNEGMREAQMQVPYPGSIAQRKKRGLKEGGKLHKLAESEDDDMEHQLEMGIPIEADEHNLSLTKGRKIAMDHLEEHDDYYTKLKKAGLRNGGGR